MAMSTFTDESRNFIRLAHVVIEVGTPCVRRAFDHTLTADEFFFGPTKNLRKKKYNGIGHWLAVEDKFLRLFCPSSNRKFKLYQEQWDRLYDQNRQVICTSSSGFDISMLTALFGILLHNDQTIPVFEHAKKLRDKRNRLYGHAASCRINTQDFDRELAELRKILEDLGRTCNYCPNADVDRWLSAPITETEEELRKLSKKIQELTESDAESMRQMAEHIVNAVKSSNAAALVPISNDITKLSNSVEKLLSVTNHSDSQNSDMALHVRQLVSELSKLSAIHPLLCELLSKLDDENVAEIVEKLRNELMIYFDKRLLQTEATVKQGTSELLADHSVDVKKFMTEKFEDLAASASRSLQSLQLATAVPAPATMTVYNFNGAVMIPQIGDNNVVNIGQPQPRRPRSSPCLSSSAAHPAVHPAASYPAICASSSPRAITSGKQAASAGSKPKKQIIVANRVASDEDLKLISDKIGKDWRDLGPQLDKSFDAAAHGSGHDAELAYQMLLQWRRDNGDGATLQTVTQALAKIRRLDIAKEFNTAK